MTASYMDFVLAFFDIRVGIIIVVVVIFVVVSDEERGLNVCPRDL